MVHRGVAGRSPLTVAGRRMLVLGVLLVALLATLVLIRVDRAGADDDHCARFAADAEARAAQVSGAGRPVLVIGDSWSVGLGLDRPQASWPARLDGAVRVEGFSGSGFSRGASACTAVSFAERAAALPVGTESLVVVEGGLNDFDQSGADIRAGFADLMEALEGHDVVVVGPAAAPRRAARVPRVDELLSRLAHEYDVPYIRSAELDLTYLDDRLHLTEHGHAAFGDYVAGELSALGY